MGAKDREGGGELATSHEPRGWELVLVVVGSWRRFIWKFFVIEIVDPCVSLREEGGSSYEGILARMSGG